MEHIRNSALAHKEKYWELFKERRLAQKVLQKPGNFIDRFIDRVFFCVLNNDQLLRMLFVETGFSWIAAIHILTFKFIFEDSFVCPQHNMMCYYHKVCTGSKKHLKETLRLVLKLSDGAYSLKGLNGVDQTQKQMIVKAECIILANISLFTLSNDAFFS